MKFVIKDRRDYEWARDLIRRRDLTARCTVLDESVFGETIRGSWRNGCWLTDYTGAVPVAAA